MRITEAARRLGTSARMLRYREALGLLPAQRASGSDSRRHRTYDEHDLEVMRLALELERRYDVSPAELAFGLRVLADPTVAAAVRDLGARLGHLSPAPSAAEIERERALRWLGRSGMAPLPSQSRPAPEARSGAQSGGQSGAPSGAPSQSRVTSSKSATNSE